jgi:hypothetical protein
MQNRPTPHPVTPRSSTQQIPAVMLPFKTFPMGDLHAAREARKAQRELWATLDLRQDFADEAWMRDHIKAAGIRVPIQMEPATVNRLRIMLKRIQIAGIEIKDSLGTTLAGFLMLNPGLPLWAALALVLESTGRFIRAAGRLAKERLDKSLSIETSSRI